MWRAKKLSRKRNEERANPLNHHSLKKLITEMRNRQ
uniref:Uncharacterized protein n=1 Tax=Parascaris equorum TaxID=6256 RepID=A0A914SCV4_PAREQ